MLEKDHYGLERVKERILEYLAVQQRVKKLKGPILCLVGPPGVGKTSLGQSIARATNRKFVRMSLGGVRDEAEIRGHRRTYIGSMPGKIMQNLSKSGIRNPLFLLDEMDKMSMDFRGDPSSALLEVLDPEQNPYLRRSLSRGGFRSVRSDVRLHGQYLEYSAAAAGSHGGDSPPGLHGGRKAQDRRSYLVPKQIKANGLKDGEMAISRDCVPRYHPALHPRGWGTESGARDLQDLPQGREGRPAQAAGGAHVVPKGLEKYLGVRRFRYGRAEENNQVGQVTGLAWTEVGGELLTIEAAVVPGKGKFIYTGQLGDVMQESIQAAMTVVRGRAALLGIDEDFHQKFDLHIHVPEGATPKDGPSAGVACARHWYPR